MSKSKKIKYVCVWAILVLIVGLGCVLFLRPDTDEVVNRVYLQNGDEVNFNPVGTIGKRKPDSYDENYRVLSEEEFINDFPQSVEQIPLINLPDSVVNLRHCYQLPADGKDPLGQYEKIYQWETEPYGDSFGGTIDITQELGAYTAKADRGYVELTLYLGEPQRLDVKEFARRGHLTDAHSNINGKWGMVTGLTNENLPDGRGEYSALFEDIRGEGIGMYLYANNVSREYVAHVLDILTGGWEMSVE